jgi:hypothetical protein
MTSQPAQQIPGVYHRKIGDIVVTAISDGYLDGSLDVMRNVDLETAHRLLKEAFRAGAADQCQCLPDPFQGPHCDRRYRLG